MYKTNFEFPPSKNEYIPPFHGLYKFDLYLSLEMHNSKL